MQSDSSKNPIDNFLYHVISSPNSLNVNGGKVILDARAKYFFKNGLFFHHHSRLHLLVYETSFEEFLILKRIDPQ